MEHMKLGYIIALGNWFIFKQISYLKFRYSIIIIYIARTFRFKFELRYNGHGHGYFLEDGYESENKIIGNLGVLVKPGIILPTDRKWDMKVYIDNFGFYIYILFCYSL